MVDDDVVFLAPGQPAMRGKAASAALQSSLSAMRIDGAGRRAGRARVSVASPTSGITSAWRSRHAPEARADPRGAALSVCSCERPLDDPARREYAHRHRSLTGRTPCSSCGPRMRMLRRRPAGRLRAGAHLLVRMRAACAEEAVLHGLCPTCGGELVPRPRRPANEGSARTIPHQTNGEGRRLPACR